MQNYLEDITPLILYDNAFCIGIILSYMKKLINSLEAIQYYIEVDAWDEKWKCHLLNRKEV
jgi:hypothetical protein